MQERVMFGLKFEKLGINLPKKREKVGKFAKKCDFLKTMQMKQLEINYQNILKRKY